METITYDTMPFVILKDSVYAQISTIKQSVSQLNPFCKQYFESISQEIGNYKGRLCKAIDFTLAASQKAQKFNTENNRDCTSWNVDQRKEVFVLIICAQGELIEAAAEGHTIKVVTVDHHEKRFNFKNNKGREDFSALDQMMYSSIIESTVESCFKQVFEVIHKRVQSFGLGELYWYLDFKDLNESLKVQNQFFKEHATIYFKPLFRHYKNNVYKHVQAEKQDILKLFDEFDRAQHPEDYIAEAAVVVNEDNSTPTFFGADVKVEVKEEEMKETK